MITPTYNNLFLQRRPNTFFVLKHCRATWLNHISNIHLKPLGSHAIMSVYNLSITNNYIPSVCKRALILPFLKLSKNPSYRLISLLFTFSRIMKKILLMLRVPHFSLFFPWWLYEKPFNFHYPNNKLEVFSQNHNQTNTLLVTIDINKAFSTVPYYIIYNKILNTHMYTYKKCFNKSKQVGYPRLLN